RAVGGEHVVGRVAGTGFALDGLAHRGQELRIALPGRVAREAQVEGLLGLRDDVRGRGEVRIAGVELEHPRRLLGREMARALAAGGPLHVSADVAPHRGYSTLGPRRARSRSAPRSCARWCR